MMTQFLEEVLTEVYKLPPEKADEHQQILDWLNNNVNDNFRFFGVQLVLKPIDDYRMISLHQ